jgi:Kef-type K+ transport system membrane component KefB
MLGAQWLPLLFGMHYGLVRQGVLALTMIALAFIMIHVGYEFELERANLKQYGWDYVVAFAAAFFPWLLVTLYFVYAMLPPEAWTSWETWKESLLVGRFASPTATGVLFSMLAAAGLTSTWVYRKARVLVIFDDLDTVLLLIPLQALIVGWAWQLGIAAMLMICLLAIAYLWMHRLPLPVSWPWVAAYAAVITCVCQIIEVSSKTLNESAPIQVDVLLPAFVLGCLMRRPTGSDSQPSHTGNAGEQRAATIVASIFMLLVGLSMPPMIGDPSTERAAQSALTQPTVTLSQPAMGWGALAVHVLLVTALANLGKMVPALCYRRQAHRRERLALAIAMWPRGEVGAGILVISLSYGIGGPVLTVATLSLALNLVLTGLYILAVKKLVQPSAVADNVDGNYATTR